MSQTNRAFFLDRDGVILREGSCGVVKKIELVPETGKAFRAIKESGFEIIVVTNQACVAFGECSEADVVETHRRMDRFLFSHGLPVPDAYYFCPHHPQGTESRYAVRCECRKPAPGLILKAVKERKIDLSKSFFIGDRMTDMEAGLSAAVGKVVLVRTGFGERHVAAAKERNVPVVDRLLDAVRLYR